MRHHRNPRSAEPAPIDERSVVQLVRNNQIPIAGQSRYKTYVRGIAAGEHESILHVQPLAHRSFKRDVRLVLPMYQP